MSIEKSDSQMFYTPVSDEKRINTAASELFNNIVTSWRANTALPR